MLGLERRLEALSEPAMQQAMLNELVDTFEFAESDRSYVLQSRAHHGNASARLALQVMALDPGVLVLLPMIVSVSLISWHTIGDGLGCGNFMSPLKAAKH